MLLRPATASDFTFLTEMLLEACNWDGTPWYDLDKARADDHAWRYVADWPTLGVASGFRRRGIARAVMAELIAVARGASYSRLSLSVDPDNPARGLYESLGFRKVGVVGTSDTMVLDF